MAEFDPFADLLTPQRSSTPKSDFDPFEDLITAKTGDRSLGSMIGSGINQTVEQTGLMTSTVLGRSPEVIASDLADVRAGDKDKSARERLYEERVQGAQKGFNDRPGLVSAWDTAAAIVSDPKVAAAAGVNAITPSVMSLGGAAAGAYGGGLIGSAVGPAGTVIGSVVGGLAGMFGGSMTASMQGEITETLTKEMAKRKIDPTNIEAVTGAIKADPSLLEDAIERSAKRAGATAGVETAVGAATAGLGAVALRGATSLGRKVGVVGAGTLAEGGGEGLGSIAADVAVGEEINYGQALGETIMGTLVGAPVAGVELAAGARTANRAKGPPPIEEVFEELETAGSVDEVIDVASRAVGRDLDGDLDLDETTGSSEVEPPAETRTNSVQVSEPEEIGTNVEPISARTPEDAVEYTTADELDSLLGTNDGRSGDGVQVPVDPDVGSVGTDVGELGDLPGSGGIDGRADAGVESPVRDEALDVDSDTQPLAGPADVPAVPPAIPMGGQGVAAEPTGEALATTGDTSLPQAAQAQPVVAQAEQGAAGPVRNGPPRVVQTGEPTNIDSKDVGPDGQVSVAQGQTASGSDGQSSLVQPATKGLPPETQSGLSFKRGATGSEQIQNVVQGESDLAARGSSANLVDGSATALKGDVKSTNAYAETLRNVVGGETFSKQPFSSRDAETQRTVLTSVIGAAQNPKVLKAVVELVPVDVVNDLRRQKIPTERLFKDETVLKSVLSADGNGPVPGLNKADAIVRGVARVAAEVGGAVNVPRRAGETLPAVKAGKIQGRQGGTPNSAGLSGEVGAGTSASPSILPADPTVQPRERSGRYTRVSIEQRVARVKHHESELRKTWKNGSDVEVIETIDAAPAEVRAAAKKGGGAPEGFVHKGKVYLVADQLKSARDVHRVLLHEQTGHLGLRGAFGTELNKVLDEVALSRPKEVAARMAAEPGLDRRGAAEEVLAYWAQDRPDATIPQRVMGAIRKALRAMGFKLTLSDADIVTSILKPARDFIEKGSGRVSNGKVAFSRVFHGTPHRFDKFDSAHIGNGEGAQAFGYGHYFASKKEIAEWYRSELSAQRMMVGGEMADESNPVHVAAATRNEFGTVDEAVAYLTEESQANYNTNAHKAVAKEAIEVLRSGQKLPEVTENKGALYEVDIPEDSEMLLWDKKLNEQPEAMKTAIAGLRAEGWSFRDSMTGEQFYQYIGQSLPQKGDRSATKFFAERGVRGIKYFDNDSRKKGEGTFNYVVFDDADIKVANVAFSRAQEGTPAFKKSGGPAKPVVDGLQRDAKLLRNALEGPPLRSQSATLGVVPSSVVGQMVRVSKNPEVLRTVVSSLPVDVVDLLARKEIAPEQLLRDPAMLKNVLAVNGATDVSLAVDKPTARLLVRNVANAAAEVAGSSKVAGRFLKGNAAPKAGGRDTVSGAQQGFPSSGLGDSNIAFSRNGFSVNDPSNLDNFVRKVQDRFVDLKEVVDTIQKTAGRLADKWNPYLQEELSHDRKATQTKNFLTDELDPLYKEMLMRKVKREDFEKYLHNKHAEERNRYVATKNPKFPDGASGIKTADARAYLAGLTPTQKRDYESLERHIRSINKKTQEILVASGLEKQSTIDAWNAVYKYYVPLERDGKAGSGVPFNTKGSQGLSVKGPSSKRSQGSSREVINIVPNLVSQRERAISRAEDNRVSQSLWGLAALNPQADFWKPVDPTKPHLWTGNDLQALGINPADATIFQTPQKQVVDQKTGLVTMQTDGRIKEMPNVVSMRVNGEDRFVVFNADNERALKTALAMKNLETARLEGVMANAAAITRYFASINTQFNPIFGIVNVTRDVQGALVNLSSTPLAGKQAAVIAQLRHTLPLYLHIRNKRSGNTKNSVWGIDITRVRDKYQEFRKEGGGTAFRAMFEDSTERARSMEKDIKTMGQGAWRRLGGLNNNPVGNWLTDYNEALENATRLAVYIVATEQMNLTKQQGASISKNISVNFNRKGNIGTTMGALFAFFNAATQGTARLSETVFEKTPNGKMPFKLSRKGKQIVAGGVALGALQAIALAAAGFDDDDIPEFIKERNLIFPTGGTNYFSLPMPLGLHVLPNVGRIATEFYQSGGKKGAEKLVGFLGIVADAFNPIGNAGLSMQTVTPTIGDPAVALFENRDWTGKDIARKDLNGLKETPGHTRAKDTATSVSKFLSEAINKLTGGTEYKPGQFSPTPDQIDYLGAQLGGGVVREAMKIDQTVRSMWSGEELPWHKRPLVGRFYGDTKGAAAESNKFYDNLKEINGHDLEIKGRTGDKLPVDDYKALNPEWRMIDESKAVYRDVSKLRKHKRELVAKDAPREEVKAVEEKMTAMMERFNQRVDALQQPNR